MAASVQVVREHLAAALQELDATKGTLSKERVSEHARQGKLQAELKQGTEELEEIQKGAGELGRRVRAASAAKEHEGQLKRVEQLGGEIATLVAARERALDEAEERLGDRYRLRATAADVTKRFHGRIEVHVARTGELADYEAVLVNLLQGSNLQYKPLAATLAKCMSPRELLMNVEDSNSDAIAESAKISKDRALRLVAHLQEKHIAPLLLAPLQDAVDFAHCSTAPNISRPVSSRSGSACTVVLPMLLAAEHESILLDQPEDHLDNAFIVDTLVQAIRDRANDGQVLVATHNANVPVLGDAQNVIVLASDGRHGFVDTAGPLNDDDIVGSITTLMEGGAEAFARRAAFYSQHAHD